MSTVLVIDPSASVRETLRIVLGHEHQVTALATFPEAPGGRPPDVVLLGLPPPPRDEAAVGRRLLRDFPDVPLLLLHAADAVDVSAVVPPYVPFECLAKPFDAYAVRARIRSLVGVRHRRAAAEPAAFAPRWPLAPPYVTAEAASVARQVLASRLAVMLVQGEPGTGVGSVVRALRSSGRWPGAFIELDGARLGGGELTAALPAPRTAATVHVTRLDRAPWPVQAELAGILDDIQTGARDQRLVCSTERDLCALTAAGGFLPELAYAVSAVPIVLAPLRERSDDVPALVEALTRTLLPRLGLDAVDYRPAALERLSRYLWFGNIAELEAVLIRTLVLHRPRVVEPQQLVFLPEQTQPALAQRMPATAAVTPRPAAASNLVVAPHSVDLEIALGELAHELRNPMVTIKTVAQHFDGIVADPEARQRFSELMVDAVARMDGLVETLLEFSRFRTPAQRPTDVGTLLDRALDEQRQALADREVKVERHGATPGVVAIDGEQVQFALRCLCRGLLPSLAPHSTLVAHVHANGTVELRLHTEPSIAARLSAWVEPQANGVEEPPPLAVALAAALLARNNGVLTITRGDAATTAIGIEWKHVAERSAVTN